MTDTKVEPTSAARPAGRGGNRFFRFFREVIAELTKVIWPTRKELITYTLVVLVFVSVMVALVAGLDIGFSRVILWMFG